MTRFLVNVNVRDINGVIEELDRLPDRRIPRPIPSRHCSGNPGPIRWKTLALFRYQAIKWMPKGVQHYSMFKVILIRDLCIEHPRYFIEKSGQKAISTSHRFRRGSTGLVRGLLIEQQNE